MKNTSERTERTIELTCRVDGVEVSLEELAAAIVAAGGIVDKRAGTRAAQKVDEETRWALTEAGRQALGEVA